VAGKGVPAALYGAFASGTVRARAFQRQGPKDLLYRVNRTLRRRGGEGLFCTLTYALFDFRARELRLGSSGLPYPVHYRARLGRAELVELPGIPLGAFDDTLYEERTIPLEAGDVFVFHTDGLTEATSGAEDYGVERLRALVEKRATETADALGESIVADLHGFLGDDVPAAVVTVLVVKVRACAGCGAGIRASRSTRRCASSPAMPSSTGAFATCRSTPRSSRRRRRGPWAPRSGSSSRCRTTTSSSG
jgi:phosphoserine phosphatase RsbU/P